MALSTAYLALQAEVTTDPLGRGYAPMTDAQVAADMNTAYRTLSQPLVPRSSLKNYLLGAGKLGTLLTATSPNAKLAVALFADPDYQAVNLADARFQALLAGVVSEGVLASADQAALLALADVPLTRAVEVFGVPVGALDIFAVRGS